MIVRVGTRRREVPRGTPSRRLATNSDQMPNGVNNRTIEINSGDQTLAYFGCFLDVYDPANTVNGLPVQAWLAGTHHCLVAQIACDDAPVLTGGSVTASPESSDKPAQRNLQVTTSDNPGGAGTHRIHQTSDARPSRPALATSAIVDELMIDWGRVPWATWPGSFGRGPTLARWCRWRTDTTPSTPCE